MHKFGNVYFFAISLIMYLGEVTPLYVGTIKAFSTLGVLLMMMAVSAIMAGLDDLKRHENDREINHSQAHCLVPNNIPKKLFDSKAKNWEDVNVGDVLIIKEDEPLPADLLPLYCSGEGGNCYVSTANLDGETNLKLKTAPSATQAKFAESEIKAGKKDVEKLLPVVHKLSGTVVAEEPSGNIHDFKGSLTIDGSSKSLGASQLLLRGTVLRNTAVCIGIVVYCGGNTRMILNSRPAPSKLSSLEFFTNTSMKLILVVQALLALLSSVLHDHHKGYFHHLWYVFPRKDLWLSDLPAYWLTFFTLFSNLMPISLYPTTEFCNAMQSFFIKNDRDMYHQDESGDFAARARSSNLCTELGQVKYIFSDKTGTLTQNVMELKRLSIGGKTYGTLSQQDGFNGKEEVEKSRQTKDQKPAVDAFLEALSVAHTVMATQKDNELIYEAESPDEHALVTAAGNLGFRFLQRKGDTLFCKVQDQQGPREKSYKILATNAFSSARKRMSVLVQYTDEGNKKQDPKFMLLVKGADNVMLERAVGGDGDSSTTSSTTNHAKLKEDLREFSKEGLRTLVIGSKQLDKKFVKEWVREYEEANRMTHGREEALEKAAEKLENDITILGATAIEDKLQEHVPETISKIRQAGIKLWVLTGDKLETARNIGFSTKVLDNFMNIQVIDEDEEGGVTLDKAVESLCISVSQGREGAIMVTGKQLTRILGNSGEKKEFLDSAQLCKVLIACRVSPMQKAECVRLVREGIPARQNPVGACGGRAKIHQLPWRLAMVPTTCQ
jgi:phospholipid-transporting ATPase